ncbi:type VII toxin-antitoxin system HepT family RNase toxin [Marinomonas flavescens]|uniref:type VII toxin-antitoxin system HepT family RNase toxin n=1 Tax=Marinomonas flavescens TaxID=2529379 RepID=UPI001A9CBD43|nr:HepT-like ribonuclease domain-containing protein [Marinomonas flavescens]
MVEHLVGLLVGNATEQSLIRLASENESVTALWIYGSRAKGSHHSASDYDLAVLFNSHIDDPLERRLRPELLSLDWTKRLNMPEASISVVDIQMVPVPLAMNAISGILLYCESHDARLMAESVIMSKAELDYHYHFKHFDKSLIVDSCYLTSVRSSTKTYQLELEELQHILITRNLSVFEYRACERNLQVSIEAAIGIAKHCSKALTGTSPAEAYQSFETLSQRSILNLDELKNWRKVIGLRNALVHDYLNIDPEIVRKRSFYAVISSHLFAL